MSANRESNRTEIRGRGRICGICLMCLLGILLSLGKPVRSQAGPLNQGSENYRNVVYQAGDMEVKIHVGLSGNVVREGRFAPAHLQLTNQGGDFEGYFRMYLNAQDVGVSGRCVVEKKVQVAAGESKEYSMIVPCNTAGVQTALCDQKGRLLKGSNLAKQFVNLGTLRSDQAIMGCISENNSSLDYIADAGGEDLQDWMLTEDPRSLDMFDILVINQFDTTQLSDKQRAAVITWVSRGGTLIFGTGAQPEKTLKAFSGDLLHGTIGDTKRITTKYGMDLDVSELQLENMKSVLEQDDDMLLGQMDYGKGSVMVAAFDLGVANDEMAKQLKTLFFLNMSADRRGLLDKEQEMMDSDLWIDYDTWSEYSLSDGLDATEVNGLPNITLYAFLLIMYAFFIGPILYSILRKKDRREWLWKLIPLSAVICSVLIYLIGTGTRVKHPYMNYLSLMDLSYEEEPSIETYLQITSPNNDKFDVEVAGNNHIIPYAMRQYQTTGDQDASIEYKNRIDYRTDKTIFHMDNLAAFEGLVFKEKQKPQEEGRVQFTELGLSDKTNLKGIVTNQTGYDMEQCVIVCGNGVLSLGDLKKGESIALDQIKTSTAWILDNSPSSSGNINSGVAETVTGYRNMMQIGESKDIAGLRRTVLLDRYYHIGDLDGSYYFYGFIASGQDTAFTSQFDLDLYGETAIVQKLRSEDMGEDAREMLGNLKIFALDLPADVSDNVSLSPKEYRVTYDMTSAGTLDQLQLSYRSNLNNEFSVLSGWDYDYDSSFAFFGTVEAVNQKNGKQEVLFNGGEEKTVTDLSQYVDADGDLELIYKINLDTVKTEHPDIEGYVNGYQLPELILERRVAK